MSHTADPGAGLAAARVTGQGSGVLVQSAISIVSTALIGIALLPALIQAFLDKPLYYPEATFTFGNFARLFTDPEILQTFGTTAIFCLIVVSFSMLVGTTLAILVGRTDLPGRGWLLGVLLWPLFISPQIIGFGAIWPTVLMASPPPSSAMRSACACRGTSTRWSASPSSAASPPRR